MSYFAWKGSKFAVPLALCTAECFTAGAFAADRPARPPAAVVPAIGQSADATIVALDIDGLLDLSSSNSALQLQLAVGAAETLDLRLRPLHVATRETQIVVGSTMRPADIDFSRIATFSGEIAGSAGSHAYLATSPYGTWGYVLDPSSGARYAIGPKDANGAALPSGQAAVFRVAAGGGSLPPGVSFCGVHGEIAAGLPVDPGVGDGFERGRGGPAVRGLRNIEIAVETDYEYFTLFGNLQAAGAYVVAAYGAVADIYVRDVNANVSLSFVRLWDTPADLFDDPDPLGPFQNYWEANMGAVHRDVAQFFSGRRNLPAGGVAYLQGLCNGASYSWSGYTMGVFYDPTQPSAFNRDVMIPAHELGHNCATGHTQDYGLDTCHIETSQPRRGTIMSYCGQTFTGGDANHDMWFHSVTATVMRSYIATRGCIGFDCNRNGVDDNLDISGGASLDTNANGVPDECEDCNGNGTFDGLDISGGASLDRNANLIPDECEADCNNNQIPDDLDLLPTVQQVTFSDNFETNLGWTVTNSAGLQSGAWQRGVPPQTASGPPADGDGSGQCYVTQLSGGDVDGGSTTLTSPTLNMSGGGWSFGYLYFLRLGSSGGADRMIVEVNSNNGAGAWVEVARHRHDGFLSWRSNVVDSAMMAAAGVTQTATMRVRFTVNDADPDGTVEGAVDGFFVGRTTAAVSADLDFDMRPDACTGDCDADGTIDYLEVIADMSLDLNRNVVLDSCEDCDNDGVTDLVELNHANNVWVADLILPNLREYLGTYGTQTANSANATLSEPQDVIITADRRVLVSSKLDSRIVELSVAGAFVRDLVPSGSGGLFWPAAMTIAPWGNLLVASNRSNNVLEYDIDTGAFVRAFVLNGAGGLSTPFGLAFKPGGNLFVTSGTGQVLEFDRNTGAFVRVLVSAAANGGLLSPRGILWLPSGNLLVASHDTDQVLEYDGVSGAFVRQFSQVGNGTVLTLDQPWCIRLGPDGDVYVSRTHDHAVPIPPPGGGHPDPILNGGGSPLHLSNARIYRFSPATGYFVLCYVMGVNSNLTNPTGFDFVPDAGTDCNNNQFPDNCDIATGRSADINDDGTPDECQTICIGDLNGDGVVDLTDLATLLANFGAIGSATYQQGDLSGDGNVGLDDLALLLARFGVPC